MQNLPPCTCGSHPRKVDPACPLTAHVDRASAMQRLGARYDEQAEQFPIMRRDIPRDLYIRRNLQSQLRIDRARLAGRLP